jgi:hypothetical protein
MSMIMKILWTILCLGLVLGAVALATWGITAPTAEVTKQIPTNRFLKKE